MNIKNNYFVTKKIYNLFIPKEERLYIKRDLEDSGTVTMEQASNCLHIQGSIANNQKFFKNCYAIMCDGIAICGKNNESIGDTLTKEEEEENITLNLSHIVVWEKDVSFSYEEKGKFFIYLCKKGFLKNWQKEQGEIVDKFVLDASREEAE